MDMNRITDMTEFFDRRRKYTFLDCIVNVYKGCQLILGGVLGSIMFPFWVTYDFFYDLVIKVFHLERKRDVYETLEEGLVKTFEKRNIEVEEILVYDSAQNYLIRVKR